MSRQDSGVLCTRSRCLASKFGRHEIVDFTAALAVTSQADAAADASCCYFAGRISTSRVIQVLLWPGQPVTE